MAAEVERYLPNGNRPEMVDPFGGDSAVGYNALLHAMARAEANYRITYYQGNDKHEVSIEEIRAAVLKPEPDRNTILGIAGALFLADLVEIQRLPKAEDEEIDSA